MPKPSSSASNSRPTALFPKVDWEKAKPTAACPQPAGAGCISTGWRDETRDWLENSSGLDETVISALLQSETRPRCAAYEDGLLLNLRGINHNPAPSPRT